VAFLFAGTSRRARPLFVQASGFACKHGLSCPAVSRLRLTILWLSAFSLVALFYGPLFAWSPITPGFIRTTLGSGVWQEFGSGLPPVVVTRLFYSAINRQLLAATYGRGIWAISRKLTVGPLATAR